MTIKFPNNLSERKNVNGFTKDTAGDDLGERCGSTSHLIYSKNYHNGWIFPPLTLFYVFISLLAFSELTNLCIYVVVVSVRKDYTSSVFSTLEEAV